jgi:hypothetical protein
LVVQGFAPLEVGMCGSSSRIEDISVARGLARVPVL